MNPAPFPCRHFPNVSDKKKNTEKSQECIHFYPNRSFQVRTIITSPNQWPCSPLKVNKGPSDLLRKWRNWKVTTATVPTINCGRTLFISRPRDSHECTILVSGPEIAWPQKEFPSSGSYWKPSWSRPHFRVVIGAVIILMPLSPSLCFLLLLFILLRFYGTLSSCFIGLFLPSRKLRKEE